MANPNFDQIDNSSILYPNNDDPFAQTILTPYSEQKFDLLGSKAEHASFAYDGYGIYDQYNDSGPSSVQFGDGMEASEGADTHINGNDGGLNGNVRLTDLHDEPNMDGPPLPLSPSYDSTTNEIQVNGHHSSSAKPNGIAGNDVQTSKTLTMAISKNSSTPLLESITVRGYVQCFIPVRNMH